MRFRSTLTPMSVLLLVALSACGGGGGGGDGVASLSGDDDGNGTTSTTLSDEEAEEALLDWAACMRGEGLDVPDPKVDSNGRVQIGVGLSSDDDEEDGGTDGASAPPDRDTFEAATEKCGEPPRLGGELSEEDREEMQEQALALAECMRDEGIEDFPDPDFSEMGPGAGPRTRENRVDDDDDAADADGDGESCMVAGPFGVIDLDDPEMSAAFDTCSDKVGMERPGIGANGGVADREVEGVVKRPGRTTTIAVGILVLVAGAGSAVALAGGDDDGGDDGSGVATSTAGVEQRDLVVTDSYDGSLGYGEARDYVTDRSGVVTTVAAGGTTIAIGGALFSVDFEPTVLLAGPVPAYRALDVDATDGPDVQQLEQALVDLGHGAGVTVDEHFDSGTAAAVQRWEDALDRGTPDGRVELGDMAFASGPVRIGTISADVGTRVQEGTTVLQATPTDHVVTVDLDASRSDELEPGTEVALTLPDGKETTGAVATIGSQVTESEDQAGPQASGGPTVPVTITLTDPTEADAFDTGSVQVAIERKRDDGATAVPVGALLALVEGGYAVELVDGGSTRLVGVEVGTFADGWVGVTGEGVEPGAEVVVPR